MTPWHHTPIIHITTPIVAGGDIMSSITEKARAKALEYNGGSNAVDADERTVFEEAFEAGYAERAAEEPSDEQVAQIIDQHRMYLRPDFVASMDRAECSCKSWSRKVVAVANAQAEHASHVAAQLRAARDTGEQA